MYRLAENQRNTSSFEEAVNPTGSAKIAANTTTFVEDSSKVTSDFSKLTISDNIVIQDQSIVDFLAKPQLVFNTTWVTTDTANLLLYNNDIGAILTSTAYWTNKIQGYNLVRGTAVFTLIINSNPFQQGKLLLHFLPNRSLLAADPSYFAMHNTLLASKRMQPCVEIDCRDSGAVMKIPYVTPYNFDEIVVSLGGTPPDWGTIYLSVFSPLQTGSAGETETAVSLYLHFEDFELAAPIVPQSIEWKKVPRMKSRTFARGEQQILSRGTISKGLSLAAKVADTLDSVPTLSPVATPAAWVFRGLSALASHFGWSKANIESIPIPVFRSQNRFSAVSDGVDSSVPLALITTNRVTVTSANSITDQDEMSFEFLKRVPTMFSTFTWSTTSVNGTILKDQEIDPFQFKQTSTKVISGKTATYAVGPPIYYLCNIFRSYRGSIKITIKFPKTEFHSGRLQVVFTPLDTALITTAPNLTNSTLSLREIIDLRNGNEFTLEIPYLYASNYINTGRVMGKLQFIVLNELRCPETCAQSIQCLLYACGGDDFEFQGYTNSGATDNDTTIFNNYTRVFSPQMDTKELVNEPIGNAVIPKMNLDYPQQSFGECFASVKQLLLRMSMVYYTNVAAAATGQNVAFYPYTTGVVSMNPTTGALASPNVGGDLFSFIANMYNLYHGGMAVQILPANTGDISATIGRTNLSSVQLGLVPAAFGSRGSIPWANLTAKTMSSGIFISDGAIATSVFEVPYYTNGKCSVVFNADVSTSAIGSSVVTTTSRPTSMLIFGSSSTSTMGSYMLLRAVRDDFQFSYFVGCPPILLSYV